MLPAAFPKWGSHPSAQPAGTAPVTVRRCVILLEAGRRASGSGPAGQGIVHHEGHEAEAEVRLRREHEDGGSKVSIQVA